MRCQLLALTAALVPTVFAGVKFTSPASGASVPAGTISVAWEDDGSSPSLDDLTTYTIQLIVGGNVEGTDALPLTTIASQGTFSTGNKASGTVAAGLSASVKNGYYLKITSVASEGGTLIQYSDRFSITGMTGTLAQQYQTGAEGISGPTDVPEETNAVANNAQAGAAANGAAGGEYTIPYALQTGLTKYAPMQSVPPTAITLKNFSPLYSTSAYSIATTFLPKATIATTMTASQTFSHSSRENPAQAQSLPTGNSDMEKFLRRWKD